MLELNYHHLRYFRAVAHEGHLTRAAERLNLVALGPVGADPRAGGPAGPCALRPARARLALTEAGRIALDHADAIFATGEDLVATLRETGRAQRRLRVGALATLSRNFQLTFLRPAAGPARSGGGAALRRHGRAAARPRNAGPRRGADQRAARRRRGARLRRLSPGRGAGEPGRTARAAGRPRDAGGAAGRRAADPAGAGERAAGRLRRPCASGSGCGCRSWPRWTTWP